VISLFVLFPLVLTPGDRSIVTERVRWFGGRCRTERRHDGAVGRSGSLSAMRSGQPVVLRRDRALERWCFETLTADLLARVLLAAQGVACVCKRCAGGKPDHTSGAGPMTTGWRLPVGAGSGHRGGRSRRPRWPIAARARGLLSGPCGRRRPPSGRPGAISVPEAAPADDATERCVRGIAVRRVVGADSLPTTVTGAVQGSVTSLPGLACELVPTSVPTFPWRRETPGYALKRLTYWNL
jgi:hypothetical protein